MARQPDSPPKPEKAPGIMLVPPGCGQPLADEDSPSSSLSDSQVAGSSSLPDLPGSGQRTLSRGSSTSMTSLNVRFAPLPELAPRKRRSTTPLGIASRAQMMRRRRAGMPGYDMDGAPLPPTPPIWAEDEIDRHTERVLAERQDKPPRERDIDDPFLTLGKMVKGASKQLWYKINNKKPGEGGGEDVGKQGGVVVAERTVLATIPDGDNISHSKRSEEGGVWEEEVGGHFPLNVGQTETIVEGQYSWSAAKLKPPLEDSGS
ncbi:hypothetical protein C8J57DRAFT_1287583, partial [Mycena rebaudengoi]